jgi:hypothetical protein
MRAVPAITDPELRARLALDDGAFAELVSTWIGAIPAREYTPAAFDHALAYPWERPARSYLLREDTVELLDARGGAERRAVLERFLARTPLLAIGSNGAPDVLRRKFAHFDHSDDRDALVITGHLRDFDVGASAHLAGYGALPATLFPSPGTAVRTAILWLTEPQFTQLVWTELSYAIGTLHTRFTADDAEFDVAEVVAFVSRFGTLCIDGEPVALAAVPARERTARALTQRQLLVEAARFAFGPQASAEQLVRAIHEDPTGLAPRLAATVRARGRPFVSDRWVPLVS